MQQYTTYPMWSNPRYRVVSILSLLATSSYALVWAFNFTGYSSSLPSSWIVISLPLIASMFWHQTLTIGEATFFYYERFFGFTISDINSVSLYRLHTREEKAWSCIYFIDECLRIETDFYQNKKKAPTRRSVFNHEGLVLQQGQ